MQEEAPGMVFWHARGLRVQQSLEREARRYLEHRGFEEVRTPQLLRQAIWERSGHASSYGDAMFELPDDGRPSSLKPVSCPGHAQIFARRVVSYRDLPVRLAEFGVCHRNERSGSLSGLFRLRQFVQDDGHIFCRDDQVAEELDQFIADAVGLYESCGLGRPEVRIAGRPPEGLGDQASWSWCEDHLRHAVARAGFDSVDRPGEGAFYAPKLEFHFADQMGRSWQCGTIQVDRVLPERFELEFIDENDERQRPVMLHRAMFGSLERFLALLLERHAGRIPPWIAPLPVALIPVGEADRAFAAQVSGRLRARGVPVEVSAPDESVGRRIALARNARAPGIIVVGPRERERVELSVRRGEEVFQASLDVAIEEVVRWYQPPMIAS